MFGIQNLLSTQGNSGCSYIALSTLLNAGVCLIQQPPVQQPQAQGGVCAAHQPNPTWTCIDDGLHRTGCNQWLIDVYSLLCFASTSGTYASQAADMLYSLSGAVALVPPTFYFTLPREQVLGGIGIPGATVFLPADYLDGRASSEQAEFLAHQLWYTKHVFYTSGRTNVIYGVNAINFGTLVAEDVGSSRYSAWRDRMLEAYGAPPVQLDDCQICRAYLDVVGAGFYYRSVLDIPNWIVCARRECCERYRDTKYQSQWCQFGYSD
jgi:hypothetical protein